MFCGKTNLGKLERLQERALSTIFSKKLLSYNELLKKKWPVISENESNALFDN